MNPIISPLAPGDSGPHVANLQAALLLLIDRGRIALSPDEQQMCSQKAPASGTAGPGLPGRHD